MKRRAPTLLLPIAVAGLVALMPGSLHAAAADPALRRVVLSSGGVGQFEFEADVEGAAELPLDVPLDQVDDLLKSLVVDDPAGPMLGVRLPGQQPLSESFRTLPFKQDAFASAEALFASLVGETVRIPATGARGAILSVSAFQVPGGLGQQPLTRHRLAIATADGIESVVLEDTPDIGLPSETLRGQIAAALEAIAAQRVQDRRTLVLSLRQGQRRHVRFGYVVPVPVWKTSYRLTLPAKATGSTNDGAAKSGGPAHLQAFAVVENLSGRDWHDVSVTLTSGRPVLFHTPLYQAVFNSRPEAPVDVPGAVTPPVDQFAEVSMSAAARAAPAAASPLMPVPMSPMKRFAEGRLRGPGVVTPPPAAIAESVARVEFRLASPVTASSGQSLLLPLLDRDVPAQRVALFQPGADPVHPLVALLVTNDTGGSLPPGLVSLFDRQDGGTASYVGDARLPAIAPGEDRLASFAVDLAVTVDMQRHGAVTVTGGQAAGGSLVLTRRERQVTDYRVTTPKNQPRTVLIEQPKDADNILVEPAGKGVASTPEAYRVTRDVPPGTTQTITLTTERMLHEQYDLNNADPSDMIAIANGGSVPAALRAAIEHAADLRQQMAHSQTVLTGLHEHEAAIVNDQTRVRSNLMSVPANSELQRRYLAKLQTQETDLANLRDRSEAEQKRLDDATAALAAYVAGLKL